VSFQAVTHLDPRQRLTLASQAIHMARDSRHNEYQRLFRATYGIAFMGTPHRGSEKANLGALACDIIKAIRIPTNKALIKSLKRDSAILDLISENFTNCLDSLRIASFYETLALGGHRGPVSQRHAFQCLSAS
jgi:hypothetical protein